MSREPQIMTIFVSTSCDKNGPSYGNYKIWLTVGHGDVIGDVMSVWHITCTSRHPHLYSCKILFVWHWSFVVKSSEQTSWQTHASNQPHANTPGENIITSLARLIEFTPSIHPFIYPSIHLHSLSMITYILRCIHIASDMLFYVSMCDFVLHCVTNTVCTIHISHIIFFNLYCDLS